MAHKILWLAILALCWNEPAQAQVFGRQNNQAPRPAVIKVQAPAPVKAPTTSATPEVAPANTPAEEEIELPEIPPAEMTAEQLVKVQMPIIKSINNTVQNGSPEDNKRLVQSLNALQKIKARQQNRSAEPGQEIVVKDTTVNVQNPKEFEKYLQDTFVSPLDVVVPETTDDGI